MVNENAQKILITDFNVTSEQELFEEVNNAVAALAEAIKPLIDVVAKLCSDLYKFILSVLDMPPRQRYKMIKNLGNNIYPLLFKKGKIYRCRNNC